MAGDPAGTDGGLGQQLALTLFDFGKSKKLLAYTNIMICGNTTGANLIFI
jgi:hypothetical protein